MKTNSISGFIKIILFSLSFVVFFTDCASVPTEPAMDIFPGLNESVAVIQRKKTMAGAAMSMKVWLDDVELASSVRSGQEIKIIISDGEHSIKAGSSSVDTGAAVSFTVAGEEITFFAEPQMGVLGARFKLTETARKKI